MRIKNSRKTKLKSKKLLKNYRTKCAGMVEMVYTQDLKSCILNEFAGSNPATSTKLK